MLQNYFSLSQGGKTVSRRNSISNPFIFYKEMRVMCSYIYIKYDGDNYLYKPASLVSFNFDPDKGGLYAGYEVAVAAGELDGKTIEAVGFSSSQTTLYIVNTCAVKMKVTGGEPLIIGGTMVLKTSGDNFAFLSGDNKLVRMLLGTEPFSIATLSITCGTDNTPMDAYSYVQTMLPASTGCAFENGEIVISKTFYMPATDVVLHMGLPVLRVMAELPETLETKYISAQQDCFVTVDVGNKVKSIDSVKVLALPVDFSCVRLPSGLVYKKDTALRLPSGSTVKRAPLGEYFGFVADGRTAGFTLLGGEVKIDRFFAAKDIMPTDDGGLFLVKDDGGLFYAGRIKNSNEGAGGVINGEPVYTGITVGEKYAVASQDGEYVLGSYKNGRAYFYKITPSSQSGAAPAVSLLSDTQSCVDSGGVHVFAQPGCVSIVSRTQLALAFSPTGEVVYKKVWLDAIVNASWFGTGVFPEYDTNRLVLYNSYLDQSAYYVDMKSKLYTLVGYGRIYGELSVRNRNDTVDISLIGGLSAVAGAEGRAVYAVAAGSILYLFMQSGAVKTFYIASQSRKIYAGAISQGQTVTYTVRSVSPPSMGEVKLKIKLGA